MKMRFQNPFIKPGPFPLWVWRNFFWYRKDLSIVYIFGISFCGIFNQLMRTDGKSITADLHIDLEQTNENN